MRFVDTSFWFALQAPKDRHFEAARSLARERDATLVTSNHVIGETWTLIRRRGGYRAAVGFLDRLQRIGNLETVHVDPRDERQAWVWLRQRDEREFSFVDATSFAVMRARRIHEALAFDGDFAAAGFVEVRPA